MSVSVADQIKQARRSCQEAEALLQIARRRNNDPRLIGKAIDLYQQVLDADVEIVEPYLGLAYLSFCAGDTHQAMRVLETALRIEPGNLRLMQLRHRIEKIAMRGEEAPTKPNEGIRRLGGSLRAELEADKRELEDELLGYGEDGDYDDEDYEYEDDDEAYELDDESDEAEATDSVLSPAPELPFEVGDFDEEDEAPVAKPVSSPQRQAPVKPGSPLNSGMRPASPLKPMVRPARTAAPDPAEALLGAPGPKGVISKGPAVSALQADLLQLMPGELTLSGIFDPRTVAAVRKLQREQHLPQSGRVDAATRAALAKALSDLQRRRLAQVAISGLLTEQGLLAEPLEAYYELLWRALAAPSAPHPATELAAPLQFRSRLGTPGAAGVISQGEEVDALQSLLHEAGQAIRLSGSFDLQTFAALKAWQSAHGLEPSGELDAPSRDYLNQTQQLLAELQSLLSDYCRANELPVSARIAVCCRQILALARGKALDQVLRAELPARISAELGPPGRPGRLSDGPQVELLQLMLRSRGERLPLSGRYDETTTAAVRRFQTRSKLPMTGVVDAPTAARLDPDADE